MFDRVIYYKLVGFIILHSDNIFLTFASGIHYKFFIRNMLEKLIFAYNLQLDFSSFNAADEDYSGYEYSLNGQLSEVRIVYLNRFVEEVYV